MFSTTEEAYVFCCLKKSHVYHDKRYACSSVIVTPKDLLEVREMVWKHIGSGVLNSVFCL